MAGVLQEILAAKRGEVERSRAQVSRAELERRAAQADPPRGFERALRARIAQGKRGRVAILTGCAQQVIDPNINDAAIRLLNRHGIEVASPRGEGC